MTVGETIGEEAGCLVRGGPEAERGRASHTHSQLQDGQARKDMLEACRESRHTGNMVDKLAESLAAQVRSLSAQLYVRLLALLGIEQLVISIFSCWRSETFKRFEFRNQENAKIMFQ